MNIYPSSMQERIQYVSTDFIVNNDAIGAPNDATNVRLCSKLNWYPTLNCGISMPTGQGAPPEVDNAVIYSVQITYSLRFRGVRFQGQVN